MDATEILEAAGVEATNSAIVILVWPLTGQFCVHRSDVPWFSDEFITEVMKMEAIEG